jgi:DNA modification methylase
MKLYSENKDYKLYQGNMLDMLEVIEPNSIDSVITDPPYGLTSITKRFGKEDSAECQYGKDGSFARLSRGFMGKEWDGSGIEYNIETWQKCYEVLKPGGYLLAFGGSRTFHRIACAIEDAGFEIRDTIMWLYGSGFPKSMDISKQIDKRGGESTSWFGEYLKNTLKEKNMTYSDLAKHFLSKTGGITGCVHNWVEGKNMPTIEQFNKICEILDLPFKKMEEAEREVIGEKEYTSPKKIIDIGNYNGDRIQLYNTAPATDLAKQWQGWGTALKPSFEPIIVARKPFKGSLVDNVIEYGVGGINIDECRVAFNGDKWKNQKSGNTAKAFNLNEQQREAGTGILAGYECEANENGRFPANTILTYDETDFDEVCGGFPNTKSKGSNANYEKTNQDNITHLYTNIKSGIHFEDSGSASRYFYCAKASKKDRDEGLDTFNQEKVNDGRQTPIDNAFQRGETLRKNTHPTVKPTELMQYLVRLVSPDGATILDPFNGSGSTGKAVMYENRERHKNYKYIGIELTEEYLPIAKARIEYVCKLNEEELKEMQLSIFDMMEE